MSSPPDSITNPTSSNPSTTSSTATTISPTPAPTSALPNPIFSTIITSTPSLPQSNGHHGLDNAEESPVTSSSTGNSLQGTPAFTSRTLQKSGAASYTIRKLNRPAQNPAPSVAPPLPPTPSSTTAPTTSATTIPTPILPPTPSTPSIPTPTPTPAAYPALHLTPLNDTFVPKQIALSPIGSKIKIGRQTNAKTVPNGANGYFDSKVLSRMHAEVWSEQGKVWIKDVKSSNGTFINGERLSAEAAESEPFELHTEDVVEFGIDIVSDDNKTIVHHKVAAKIHLVLNPDDVLASSREFNNWYRIAGEAPIHRRPTKPLNNTSSSNGLSFEHVLNRLQGELQKSRDTGSNLGDVSATLNEVQDTLGGGAPPNFPHPSRVPPFIPNPLKDAQTQSIAALQSQLNETQNSLAGHVGKMRDLEGLLAEHDGIKREVGGLRKLIEDAMESMSRGNGRESLNGGSNGRGRNGGRESPIAALLEAQEDADEDDSRSISSIETIRLNTADQLATIARATAGNSSRLSNGIISNAIESNNTITEDLDRERLLQEQNTKLLTRLEALSVELDEATKLGQSLRSQHAEASTTIKSLEEKVLGLEKAVEVKIIEVSDKVLLQAETKWNGWKLAFEESYKLERLSWDVEREKLNNVVKEWEEKKLLDSNNNDWDEGDSSAEDDEEDADNVVAGSASTSTSETKGNKERSTKSKSNGGSGSSSNGSKSKSNSRSRRKRRTNGGNGNVGSNNFGSNGGNGTRVGKLAAGSVSTLSDSDSTIGEGKLKSGIAAKTQAWTESTKALQSNASNNNRSGFDSGMQGGGLATQALPYIGGASAVVIIGVVAAWALSLKAKE